MTPFKQIGVLAIIGLFLSGCASAPFPVKQADLTPGVVTPALPDIPAKRISLADYRPAGDGIRDDTEAFNQAIADLSHAGGGHLDVPAAKYLIGPIQLASNIDLHLSKGATLLARNDINQFPTAPNKYFNNQIRHPDVITGDQLHDIAITGEGTIDGQGAPWWNKYRKRKGGGPQPADLYPHRPNLVVFSGCQRVLVQGVTLINSPMFHLIPQQCQDVTIDDVTITAPADSPNSDGIDPSGRRLRITNCKISVGDDNIAIKPQYPPTWPKAADSAEHLSCEDIYISNCHFGRGHGLSIGGQTIDGLKRLLVQDCTFDGTNVGIRLKTNQGTGGPVVGCVYERITMNHCKTAILVTSYYPSIPADPATMPAMQRDNTTPYWHGITFRDIVAIGSTEAGGLIALKERPMGTVRFENVQIEAKKPMRIVDAADVTFVKSQINVPNQSAGVVATRSEIKGIEVGKWTGATPPVSRTGAPHGVEDKPDTTQPMTEP